MNKMKKKINASPDKWMIFTVDRIESSTTPPEVYIKEEITWCPLRRGDFKFINDEFGVPGKIALKSFSPLFLEIVKIEEDEDEKDESLPYIVLKGFDGVAFINIYSNNEIYMEGTLSYEQVDFALNYMSKLKWNKSSEEE
jgi:hypothetical protein